VSNIDTVKAVYEAFGKGDVPAILEKLDPNVEWDTQYESPAAAPWLEPRRGRDNVPGFFEALAPLQITRFEPFFFGEDGDQVVSIVNFEADHKGKHYLQPFSAHLWTFGGDGKILSFRHMVDTELHRRMAEGK
jgi:ketosteroid isomerase-like protein